METARQRVGAQMEKARVQAVNHRGAMVRERLGSRERIRLRWCLPACVVRAMR